MEVERALGIDTFMDAEEHLVFLGDKGLAAVRAYKAEG